MKACDCSLLAEIAKLRERCEKLEALSYIDGLTGLYNYRYFQRSLEMEMERTRRTMLPTSLIMVDLDFFRKINETYGHESGNTALSWVGKALRDGIRLIDIACRYGGEEFALIQPSTSISQAISIADRLRGQISSSPLSLNGGPVHVTASFGVAVFSFTDNWTMSEFVSIADSYLYKAKASGRNRVCYQEIPAVLPEIGVTQDEKDFLFGGGSEADKEKSR